MYTQHIPYTDANRNGKSTVMTYVILYKCIMNYFSKPTTIIKHK